MNLLSELPAYWLNFLLHTALLSVFVGGLCLLLRDPGRRAFAAAAGALAIVVLPWVSALGWFQEIPSPAAGPAAPAEERPWSGWVIRIDGTSTANTVVADPMREDPVPRRTSFDWKEGIAGVWIAGGLAGLVVVAVRTARLRRWTASLRGPTDGEWASLVPFASGARSGFLISGNGTGPCAVGFSRMRMVVPESVLGDGCHGKLRWVVRHEAEHIRAGDPWLAVLLSLAKCVAWWNPVVHLLARRWAEDRERVCDARALAMPDEGRSYGEFLLDLTEAWTAPAGVPMAASGGAKRLAKRLRALVRGEHVATRSAASAVLTLLFIAGGGLLASCAGVKTGGGEVSTGAAAKPDTEYWMRVGNPAKEPKPTRSPQIRITASFLQSDDPFPEAGSILSNLEWQLMMRRAVQKAGTHLMTAPSVMAKDGMATSTYIVHTEPGNKDIPDVRKVPFVGLSLESVPVIKGREVSLSVDCLWNYEPGRSPMELTASFDGKWPAPSKDFDWKTVRSASAKQTRLLSAGEYMLISLKGLPEGVHIMAMFKAEPIDAAGNVVKDFGVRIEVPHHVQEMPDFRIRGGILEVPDDKDAMDYLPVPKGDLNTGKGELWRKQTPEQVRKHVQQHHKDAKWTDLEPVMILGGLPEARWRVSDFKMKLAPGQRSRGFDDLMRTSAPLDPANAAMQGFNRLEYVKEAKGQPNETLFFVIERLPR